MKLIRGLFAAGFLIGIYFLVHSFSSGNRLPEGEGDVLDVELWQSVPPALASILILGSLFGYAAVRVIARAETQRHGGTILK